jgi:hypothetical protein
MKKAILTTCGVLLFAVSVAGIPYACRAACAQLLYSRAKLGSVKDDTGAVLSSCETANRLYRPNYYFCLLAAEGAFRSGVRPDKTIDVRLLERARYWCDVGLGHNPYNSELRRMKAWLLASVSPADAARYWERYVDWDFWVPVNHALLVELYAQAGEIEKAFDSLRLIKDSPYYEEARRKLSEAWKKETSLPQELSGRLSQPPPR